MSAWPYTNRSNRLSFDNRLEIDSDSRVGIELQPICKVQLQEEGVCREQS